MNIHRRRIDIYLKFNIIIISITINYLYIFIIVIYRVIKVVMYTKDYK